MRIATAAEMADTDRMAQEVFRVPGLLLMEHAALGLLHEVLRRLPREGTSGNPGGSGRTRVGILVGPGNNGGDGLALGRILAGIGIPATCLLAAEPARFRADARIQLEAVEALGIEVARFDPGKDLPGDLLVDALLGTGTKGPARGEVARAIESLAACGRPIVAVDLPSGLPANGGAGQGPVVPATATVTMGLPKPFVACPVGRERCGEMALVPIGLPRSELGFRPGGMGLAVAGTGAGALPPRPAAGHKASFGKVLVVGGSPGMAGAPFLAARGALRAGAGMVRLLAGPGALAQYGAWLPEAMVEEWGGEGGDPDLLAALEWADALVLGPGLALPDPAGEAGGSVAPDAFPVAWVEVLARVVDDFPGPVVLDAGALPLAGRGTRRDPARIRVLTPHPGEAARMLGRPVGPGLPERRAAALELASGTGARVVLKGRFSLVVEGSDTWVNPTGDPGLATAGSGDVLAGVLAALLAPRIPGDPGARIRAGVWLHGAAGAGAGVPGRLAGEIADRIPEAWLRLAGLPSHATSEGYPGVLPEDGLRVVSGFRTPGGPG